MEFIQTSDDNNDEPDDNAPIVDLDGVTLPQHYQQAIVNGKHQLKVWRRHRDLSMGQLAKLADVSTSTIYYVEQSSEPADEALLEKLAVALHAHPEDLIPY